MRIQEALSAIAAGKNSQPTVRSHDGVVWLQTAYGRARIGVGNVEPCAVSVRALRAAGLFGEFQGEDGKLTVVDKGCRVSLLSIGSEPDPELLIPQDNRQRVDGAVIKRCREILPFVSKDESRPAICQVFIDPDAATGNTKIVATNGWMLAMDTVPGLAVPERTLIPANLLARVPAWPDEYWITVNNDLTWMSGHSFDLCYHTHRVDKRISHEKVIPELDGGGETLQLSYARHGKWLRAACLAEPAVMASGNKPIVVDPASGRITTGSEHSLISASMNIPKSEGIAKFGLSAGGLLLALRWLGGDVQLRYQADRYQPLRLDCEATGRVVVLMPIRL